MDQVQRSGSISGLRSVCPSVQGNRLILRADVALSYFTQTLWWKRAILIASVVPITIVTNAFRIIGTGLLAHFFGAEMAQGFFHGFSGWLVIVMASLLLFTEGLLLAQGPGGVKQEVPA